jgi:hypothetical protein
MRGMDIANLAVIGGQIAEIGEKLKMLRGQRDEINTEISALEKQLMPLVVEHSKIIAEIVGVPPTPPAPTPPIQQLSYGGGGSSPPVPQPGVTPEVMQKAKTRILKYLDDAEPGVSAADVAGALKMDPFLVRQIMGQMAREGK